MLVSMCSYCKRLEYIVLFQRVLKSMLWVGTIDWSICFVQGEYYTRTVKDLFTLNLKVLPTSFYLKECGFSKQVTKFLSKSI